MTMTKEWSAHDVFELKNTSEVEEQEEEEERYAKCDECKNQIDCHNHSIHIVYKGEATNPTEEKTLCTMCFQDMEDD